MESIASYMKNAIERSVEGIDYQSVAGIDHPCALNDYIKNS